MQTPRKNGMNIAAALLSLDRVLSAQGQSGLFRKGGRLRVRQSNLDEMPRGDQFMPWFAAQMSKHGPATASDESYGALLRWGLALPDAHAESTQENSESGVQGGADGLWAGLPWADDTVPSPQDVSLRVDLVADWFSATMPEQEPMSIGDRYWWDYGQEYRSYSQQERGLLSSLSDGLSLRAAQQPALEEMRWRLHSGVLLGEFRLTASAADGGARENGALRDVIELVAANYLGPNHDAGQGTELLHDNTPRARAPGGDALRVPPLLGDPEHPPARDGDPAGVHEALGVVLPRVGPAGLADGPPLPAARVEDHDGVRRAVAQVDVAG